MARLMGSEQPGQMLGVFAIVLGPADDEDLAKLLEADRVDGVEPDPVVTDQEADEVMGGLFEADGHPVIGMVLAQRFGPGLESLGAGLEDRALYGAGALVQAEPVGFAIGAIQADNQIVGTGGSVHGDLGMGRAHAALTPRRQLVRCRLCKVCSARVHRGGPVMVSLLTEETECDWNVEPYTTADRHPAIGFRLPLAPFYGFQAFDVRTSDGRRWLSVSLVVRAAAL
jgi:hypothetical protein